MSAQGLALPVAWLAVIALFGALEPDTFLTSANLQSILGSQAVLVVVMPAVLHRAPTASVAQTARRFSARSSAEPGSARV